jgi:ribonuclease J
VIFSSRIIPGNERGIFDLMNKLAARGVELVTEKDRHIHVSGHPCRDELRQMYAWAKPNVAIPVHGERRHLMEHAEFAKSLQVPHAIAPQNGSLIEITREGARIVDETPAGRLYVDGNFLVEAESESIKERRRLAFGGHIVVAATLTHGDLASAVDVRAMGVPSTYEFDLDHFLDVLAEAAEDAFDLLGRKDRRDAAVVEEAMRRAVRREAHRIWGKKPHVEAIILSS